MSSLPVRLGAALALAAALPAFAHSITYRADLSGANEVPTVVTDGIGVARVTLDLDNFTMRVRANFRDLTGNVTIAHIHCCTATPGVLPAGVATPLPSFPGFPAGGTAGRYDQTFDMTLGSSWNPAFVNANGGTTGTAFSALAGGIDDGRAYFNIHTTFRGGGEIAGFLTPVPEPGTWAMMAAGLLGVGAVARRRARARA